MSIHITTEPYDHQQGGDYPGSRGIVIDSERETYGIPSYAFSSGFPSAFVTDNGEVSLDEYRWPAEDALAWLDAVAAAIRAHVGDS